MPVPYGETYGQGDVIGCLIYLPKVSKVFIYLFIYFSFLSFSSN